METKTTQGGQNDKKLIILGFISIGILFLIYVRFEYQEITPDGSLRFPTLVHFRNDR